MARQLIVNEPFGKYAKGDRITEEAEIVQILSTPQAAQVLPIDVNESPSKPGSVPPLTADDKPPAKPANTSAPD